MRSYLDTLALETNRNEEFFMSSVSDEDIVIFSCGENLKFPSRAKEIFVDGTFRSCPKFFYQMFTIHTLSQNVYLLSSYYWAVSKQKVPYEALTRIARLVNSL